MGDCLASTTWSGAVTGSVGRTYDADFRPTATSVNGGHTANLTYDDDGLLTQAGALAIARDSQTGFVTGTTLGAVTDTRTYTSFGEPARYRAQVNGSDVIDIQYTARDALGRLTEKVETIDGQTATYRYSYDLAGRLEEVTKNDVAVATYAYDANGNRLARLTPPRSISIGP